MIFIVDNCSKSLNLPGSLWTLEVTVPPLPSCFPCSVSCSPHPILEPSGGPCLGEPEGWVSHLCWGSWVGFLYITDNTEQCSCDVNLFQLNLSSFISMSTWSKELYEVHQNVLLQILPIQRSIYSHWWVSGFLYVFFFFLSFLLVLSWRYFTKKSNSQILKVMLRVSLFQVIQFAFLVFHFSFPNMVWDYKNTFQLMS